MSSVKKWRKMFFVLSRAWDKEKFWVPKRNWTSDLRIPRSDALPSTVSEGYYEVHMTRVLHTAKISNVDSVMFVNRIREISLKLDKEIENDVFRLVMCVEQRKNPESSWGIEPQTALQCSTTEPQKPYGERGLLRSSYDTREELNLRPSDSALRCSTTEPQKLYSERGLLRSSYDTYSIHKHDAIDIDDPSSMQDAWHINFVVNHAHHKVSVA